VETTRAAPISSAGPANAVARSIACSGRNGSLLARPASPYAHRFTATWIAWSGSGVLTG
jgi:hypothetical protein